MVDPIDGSLIHSARFGWRNVAIRRHLEQELGIKALADSEGATMALGEYQYGAGRGHHDIVCIDVDAGIGSIEITDGAIRHGSHKMAGEIGHTTAVQDGPRCTCGKAGCLGTVCSGWSIVARLTAALAGGAKTSVSEDVRSPSMRQAIRAVFDAARAGDDLAREVVEQAAEHLGKAVAAIVNYADPELTILTGCVTDESDGMLLELVRKHVGLHVVEAATRTTAIEEGTLGPNAALIGAATLVYEDAFKLPVE